MRSLGIFLPLAGLVLIAAMPVPSDPAKMVARYFALLDAQDYAAAYGLWSNDGRATGKSLAAWRAGFRDTARTRALVGKPHDQEGAAGSLYVLVPVTVVSRLRDGTRQRFAGELTLRRVNDVPGATAEQRRWHIAEARLKRLR